MQQYNWNSCNIYLISSFISIEELVIPLLFYTDDEYWGHLETSLHGSIIYCLLLSYLSTHPQDWRKCVNFVDGWHQLESHMWGFWNIVSELLLCHLYWSFHKIHTTFYSPCYTISVCYFEKNNQCNCLQFPKPCSFCYIGLSPFNILSINSFSLAFH